jgi:ABC-type antimicrobial peptide transport system permease subunit
MRPWVYTLAGIKNEYSTRAVPLLASGVGLVFLVLCANVCGLLLARLTSRRREFSMRAALGASRGRLIRQAVVESHPYTTASDTPMVSVRCDPAS